MTQMGLDPHVPCTPFVNAVDPINYRSIETQKHTGNKKGQHNPSSAIIICMIETHQLRFSLLLIKNCRS